MRVNNSEFLKVNLGRQRKNERVKEKKGMTFTMDQDISIRKSTATQITSTHTRGLCVSVYSSVNIITFGLNYSINAVLIVKLQLTNSIRMGISFWVKCRANVQFSISFAVIVFLLLFIPFSFFAFSGLISARMHAIHSIVYVRPMLNHFYNNLVLMTVNLH